MLPAGVDGGVEPGFAPGVEFGALAAGVEGTVALEVSVPPEVAVPGAPAPGVVPDGGVCCAAAGVDGADGVVVADALSDPVCFWHPVNMTLDNTAASMTFGK